jgi:hypothetical protein
MCNVAVQLARYMDCLRFLNGTYGDVWSPTKWLEDHELDLPSGKECATWMLNCDMASSRL